MSDDTTDVPQLDAFGASVDAPRARVTDPDTSRTAADRARHGFTLKRLAVLDVLQWCGRQREPATYDRLIAVYRMRRARNVDAAWYPMQTDSGIRSRCKELRDLGLVVAVDHGGTTDSGGKAARWSTSPRGQMVDVEQLTASLPAAVAARRARR